MVNKLFVMRHGNAEFYADSDAARNLTQRGEMESRAILHGVKEELADVSCIIASPYIRAQQTAAIASEVLGLDVETNDLLTPEGNIQSVVGWLNSLEDVVPLIVTHQPFVGGFVDWLGDFDTGRHVMGTSALAGFSVSVLARGCGDLLFLKQP